jgi:chromate transporter
VTADGRSSLREIAGLFLRLGATAFGGPAVHVAMMEDEVVRRRRWLNEAAFLDLVGATQLIPGPNSTELALHIGWSRRRGAGLLVAGGAFILPSMLLTGGLGAVYVRYGALPSARQVLYGVKPVLLAVVVQAVVGMAPKAARTRRLQALGVAALALAALGAHELAVLLGCGAAATVTARDEGGEGALRQVVPVVPVVAGGAAGAATVPGVFGVFLKAGSVLFGSGYVLLALLRADLVERRHWLTEGQLLDAIAAGQVTPGPVFSTATFVGYVLAGPAGALAATVGIFLPAFVLVALSGPLVPRMRASARAGAFLDGVNVASLALMAVVTFQLGRAALVDGPSVALALGSLALLWRWRVNTAWLVLGGAAVGGALRGLGLTR